jgi:rhodanese-related sulfurtransferase
VAWQHCGVTVPTVQVSDVPGELPEGAVLLDVREDDEWAAGHAPGALHVPMGEIASRLDELPADAELFVICRSGGRSARVTQFLNANGWDAVNVDGGMSHWAASGRPLVSDGDADPEVL